MAPIENINFSFACNESHNKMTPCSLGIHCSSCDKTVFDFRKSSLNQLTNLLKKHGTVCGLFSKSQIQVKSNSNSNKVKHFIASALITIGLGLFNKALYAQTRNCDTIKRESIEEESDVLLGAIVETMPSFKDGGQNGLVKFLGKNLKYPSNESTQGKIIVNFTIDKKGNVSNPKITKSLSEAVDNEVLRVVKLMKFIPGTQAGRKTESNYILPVVICINDDSKNKK
ncbi:MAG: energy transducer TonB [Sphingobacteriales bacterium]|nr:MAG: energy transducer TonB [Sphingobacteriales bacterium]